MATIGTQLRAIRLQWGLSLREVEERSFSLAQECGEPWRRRLFEDLHADQLNTLALLSFELFAYGGVMFTAFYGVAWVLRGYLIFRSGYLPKFLGALMTVGGLAFIARNLLLVLAPACAPGGLLLLMLPGGLLLPAWLLVKGVDVRKWRVRAATNEV
jgi:hypothetical protein